MKIVISDAAVRRLYVSLLVLDALFIAMTLFNDLGWGFATTRPTRQFDLKEETTIAVWYSSVVLLLTAGAAAAASQTRHAPGSGTWRYRAAWYTTALFFLTVSMDETAGIHEKVGYVVSLLAGPIPGLTDRPGVPMIMAWVVIGVPVAVLFAIGTLALARSILSAHPLSRRCAIAGAICYVGVVAAEILEAQLMRWRSARSVQGVFEEGLELLGTTLFLFAFLEFIRYGSEPAVALERSGGTYNVTSKAA